MPRPDVLLLLARDVNRYSDDHRLLMVYRILSERPLFWYRRRCLLSREARWVLRCGIRHMLEVRQ